MGNCVGSVGAMHAADMIKELVESSGSYAKAAKKAKLSSNTLQRIVREFKTCRAGTYRRIKRAYDKQVAARRPAAEPTTTTRRPTAQQVD
jgi:AraC-like DNA-binding protein